MISKNLLLKSSWQFANVIASPPPKICYNLSDQPEMGFWGSLSRRLARESGIKMAISWLGWPRWNCLEKRWRRLMIVRYAVDLGCQTKYHLLCSICRTHRFSANFLAVIRAARSIRLSLGNALPLGCFSLIKWVQTRVETLLLCGKSSITYKKDR